MKTIVIDRRRWGTGKLLRIADHKMCCLGFACRFYGLTEKNILDKGLPAYLLNGDGRSKLPRWMMVSSFLINSDVNLAAQINDSPTLSDEEKEKQLKEIFLKHQIKLIFRGKR